MSPPDPSVGGTPGTAQATPAGSSAGDGAAASTTATVAQQGPQRSPRTGRVWLYIALVLAIVAVLVSIGAAWFVLDRLQTMELQLARRISEFDRRISAFDAAGRETRAAARDASASLSNLTARLSALENQAQETKSQQLALAALYQELTRSEDERVVADIEQTLLLAQQQLRLAGNVRAALIALEEAKARLARLDKLQFSSLQEAIGRDIARLKLMPTVDVADINARLDVLVQNVDKLKLNTGPVPTEPAAQALTPEGRWQQLWQAIWAEFKQLVRVRRVDKTDPALVPPEQAWFLRENLKLRLLAARLAVLNRDEKSFKSDLTIAQDWVQRYFAFQDAVTQSMLASLRELAALPVAQQEADLTDSIKALRSLRIATAEGEE